MSTAICSNTTPRAPAISRPLRFVPKGKRVAIGIITTKVRKSNRSTHSRRRIEEAGRSIDLDQLCLCPQCGFSSNVGTGKFPA